MQSRRSFIQRTSLFLGALAVSGSTMLLTACASVVNDLLTAFQTILNILSAAGLVPGGALVATALSNVIADVQAYEAAPAADKATLGGKLALVIQIAEAQLQTWFTGLGLTGTLAVIIESLVGVILSTLAGLLPTLPDPPKSGAGYVGIVPAEIVAARSLAHQITFKPVATITLTKGGLDKASKQFRSQFNSQLTANGYAKTF